MVLVIVQFIPFPMIPNLCLYLISFYANRSFIFPLSLTKMADKKWFNDPPGTFFGMGTKEMVFLNTPGIAKMQVKNVLWGAWEPYLPPQLRRHQLPIPQSYVLSSPIRFTMVTLVTQRGSSPSNATHHGFASVSAL